MIKTKIVNSMPEIIDDSESTPGMSRQLDIFREEIIKQNMSIFDVNLRKTHFRLKNHFDKDDVEYMYFEFQS